MKKATLKPRIEWIDVARAVTMLCVVVGHVIPPGNIRTFLYSFHVPAFFFLSGIFFSSEETFLRSTVKKFKSIMLPYYFFGLVAIAAYLLLGHYVSSQPLHSLYDCLYGLAYGSVKMHFMQFNYHLWFLPVLFSMNIIMYPIHRFVRFLSSKKQINTKALMITATAVTFVLSQIIFTYKKPPYPPFGIDTALRLLPFFVAGSTASHFKHFMDPSKCSPVKKSLRLVCSLILFTATALLSKLNESKTADNFHINYIRDTYGDRYLFLSAAILGIIAVVLLSKTIPPLDLLTYTGRKSLAILVIQKFPIMLFGSVIPFTASLIKQSNPFAILVSVAVIGICLILNAIVEALFPFVYGKPYRRISKKIGCVRFKDKKYPKR